MTTARGFLVELYRRNRVLAVLGWLHLAAFAVLLFVAPFDARTILGLNPWVKPLKFLVSIAAYVWTLAWLTRYISAHRRSVRLISWGTAVIFVGEMACVIMQSARGTTSHFNLKSPFDGLVFSVMGFLIAVNTLLVLVTLLLFLKPTERPAPAYLWGVRLGLLLFFMGSLEGAAMVANGAHTVGAPDGGAGLPFVNWSTSAGDLRVAHFLAFHALQLLPLAGFTLSRYKTDWPARRQTACVFMLAILYAACVSLIFWQAMRGRPLLSLGAFVL
ncbi:MAG TPA: hypothetical protein VKB12_01380 [Pyrinomonadaceae bacterium]|nr:hypothetical protein [Pyrinomonadaceae bacterium]